MKKKRFISLLFAVVMAAAMLAGCGESKESTADTGTDGKISISMYMWDRSMFKELTPWLEQKFPDIEFTFVQSYNTMEYYKDLLARGEEIPDIITCRRFSLNDAAPLADHLMDLSKSEAAGTFYSSYLEVNRENSGAIRWLPMCAEVDCVMANKDLFDQYNISLPTNYSEFVATIDAFEEVGIKGFQTDWYYDYTCLETMQGCAIPELMSLEGTTWRMDYESETEEQQVGLDDTVWPKVFEKYEQFLKDVRFQPGDEELQFTETTEPYFEGKTAMIRATAVMADGIREENGINSVILPYFGETSEDNWVLTYPMCQLAVSNQVEKDEAKKAAVMEVLLAIFSEEGQKHVAAGTSVLSYNKEVKIAPTAALTRASDGNEAVRIFAENPPDTFDLIFMDIMMPEMNGYEATEAIRAISNRPDARRIPIIAMTANAFAEDVQASLDAGMNGHLSKPIVMEEVVKAIARNLKS